MVESFVNDWPYYLFQQRAAELNYLKGRPEIDDRWYITSGSFKDSIRIQDEFLLLSQEMVIMQQMIEDLDAK